MQTFNIYNPELKEFKLVYNNDNVTDAMLRQRSKSFGRSSIRVSFFCDRMRFVLIYNCCFH